MDLIQVSILMTFFRHIRQEALLIQPQSLVHLVIDASCRRRPLARGPTSPTPPWSNRPTPLPHQQTPLRVPPGLRMMPVKIHYSRLKRMAVPSAQATPHPEVKGQDRATRRLTATSQNPTSHSMKMPAAGRRVIGGTPSLLRLPWQPAWVGPMP